MGRLGLAFRCFFRVLGGKPLPDELLPKPEDAPALPAAALGGDEGSARGLQLLGVMQREGRLLDFLREDIEEFDDAQIGAAVRAIHRDCRHVIDEHLELEPVVQGEEESPDEVPAGFDPSAIRLVGSVSGEPPFKGVLRHHGWRAKRVTLPPLPTGGDWLVVSPAEVEIPE